MARPAIHRVLASYVASQIIVSSHSQIPIPPQWRRRHPDRGARTTAAAATRNHLIHPPPGQRKRRDDPLATAALQALPGEAPDASAALGVRAAEAALERAVLQRAAHPGERLDEYVRAVRRLALPRGRVGEAELGRREDAPALLAADLLFPGLFGRILLSLLVLVVGISDRRRRRLRILSLVLKPDIPRVGRHARVPGVFEHALVEPLLVDGVVLETTTAGSFPLVSIFGDGASHLPPQLELLHEAVVGLGDVPRLLDQPQRARHDISRFGAPLGCGRGRGLAPPEPVRVLVQ